MSLRRFAWMRLVLLIIGLTAVGPTRCPAQTPSPEPPKANQPERVAPESLEDRVIPRAENDSTLAAPRAGRLSFLGGSMWAALAVVLLLVVVALVILRKAYPGMRVFGALSAVQVLGRTHLSPKQTLVMVKLGRRLLLLGLTEHHISHLLTLDDEAEVSQLLAQVEQSRATSATAAFVGLFAKERGKFTGPESVPGPVPESHEVRESAENSQVNAEKDLLDLKSEIGALLNKVNRLKGIGGRE